MLRSEARLTRREADVNTQWLEVDVDGVVGKVEGRGVDLASFLQKGLREKVYTQADVEEVENTRKLLDLRSQALRVQELGQLTASGLLYFRPWQAACNFFEPGLHLRLDPVDLRLQFGTFNQVIYRHSRSE